MKNKINLLIALEYLLYKAREDHPSGYFEKEKWYPHDYEKCPLCDDIREPSRKFPYSKLTHCRSLKHIAAKYEWEDLKSVRKICKEYKDRIQELKELCKEIKYTIAQLKRMPKSIRFIHDLVEKEK